MSEHDYVAVTRARRVTGISKATILAAFNSGKVRGLRDGARFKVALADVRALGQRQKPKQLSARQRAEQIIAEVA